MMRKMVEWLRAMMAAVFAPLTDEECVESGIVPARRRYDREFVERVRRGAHGDAPAGR